MTAVLLPVLLVAAGGAVDLAAAYNEKAYIQAKLDAAILAATAEPDSTKRLLTASLFMPPVEEDPDSAIKDPLVVVSNSDGSVSGTYRRNAPNHFLGLIGLDRFEIVANATAISSGNGTNGAAPCIRVLGNTSQAVLINSGADLRSQKCGIDVHSTASPAFIMNSGATIDTAKFCVKGTSYINHGKNLTNLQAGCSVSPDPYAGILPEPKVPATCDTSGVPSGSTFVLEPGVHCDVTFNGSPKITFRPGLHIIKGRMIINAGATVEATGVTFFFPDVYSEIRANGGLTFNASAPTSGPYSGILMYEATGRSSNNANKQQYVFNGSQGETLSGIIYLPNRDVVYNSKTNQISKLSMVVNTMIMNSSNWKIEPFTGPSPFVSSGKAAVRLLN